MFPNFVSLASLAIDFKPNFHWNLDQYVSCQIIYMYNDLAQW